MVQCIDLNEIKYVFLLSCDWVIGTKRLTALIFFSRLAKYIMNWLECGSSKDAVLLLNSDTTSRSLSPCEVALQKRVLLKPVLGT